MNLNLLNRTARLWISLLLVIWDREIEIRHHLKFHSWSRVFCVLQFLSFYSVQKIANQIISWFLFTVNSSFMPSHTLNKWMGIVDYSGMHQEFFILHILTCHDINEKCRMSTKKNFLIILSGSYKQIFFLWFFFIQYCGWNLMHLFVGNILVIVSNVCVCFFLHTRREFEISIKLFTRKSVKRHINKEFN